MLGPVPDGLPVTLIGIGAAVLAALRLRKRESFGTMQSRAITALAVCGLLWLLVSYVHFKQEMGRSVARDSGGDAAAIFGAVGTGPGTGMVLAALLFLVVGTAGVAGMVLDKRRQ